MHVQVDDHPGGGMVRLGGFEWLWRVTVLRSLPEGTPDATYLWLHDPENTGNSMMVRLPDNPEGLTDAQIVEYARHPTERRLISRDGTQWVFQPVPKRSNLATARAGSRRVRLVNMPEDLTLGEASPTDLLESLNPRAEYIARFSLVGGSVELSGRDLDEVIDQACARLRTGYGELDGVFQDGQQVLSAEDLREECASRQRS